MSAKVPIFYRVIFEPFQSTSNSMISVPYEAADKIYYLANSNAFMNGYGSYNKGGPEYAFHMSKYEVSNAEFVFFLNDAQIHTNDSRGKFLVFNSDGKVGLGSDTTMFFDITKSRLAYDSLQPIGERYSVSADSPSGGGSFANHPVTGVSWYGAVKYCNWLTIASGIGEGERCYTEGGGAASWKPTTASVWGVDPFVDSQRSNWLS
jgi:formylglycine-generating enzyme required for sulfatase activity